MNKEEFIIFKEKLVISARNNLVRGRVNWKAVVDDLYSDYPEENLSRHRLETLYRRNKNKFSISEMGNQERIVEAKLPTFKRHGDNLEASIKGLRENPANFSDKEIAKLFDVDIDTWRPYDIKTNAWNVTLKGSDDLPVQVINYGLQVKFKKLKDVVINKEVLKEIFNDAAELSLNNLEPPLTKPKVKEVGNTLVMGVFDVHLGKLAWWKETGENYDLKIATKRFLGAVHNIVDRAVSLGVDKIIFPIGNDFFQFDDDIPTTTKGTQVDTDVRWQKLFQKGVSMLISAINYCSRFAEIDVIWVPGNHDFKTSFYAFEVLRGYYFNNSKVFIDKDIKTRTYRLVGVNLLGFTHGDKEKMKSLHALMSTEAPKLWGQSRYREWVLGHWHRGMLNEDMGVVVRVLGSITGTDAWHYQKGFIGAVKSAQGLIYNEKVIGPSIILYETVDIEKERE